MKLPRTYNYLLETTQLTWLETLLKSLPGCEVKRVEIDGQIDFWVATAEHNIFVLSLTPVTYDGRQHYILDAMGEGNEMSFAIAKARERSSPVVFAGPLGTLFLSFLTWFSTLPPWRHNPGTAAKVWFRKRFDEI